MKSDERTRLLTRPSSKIAYFPEEGDTQNVTAEARGGFELWQIAALCGIIIGYADTSLVWATRETIASNFNCLEDSSWIMTSFTVGYCITLPLYGRLSDNYGRFAPLIVSYCIFCVGCTICGVCQAYWQLILGRITQGCGASGIISLASIIITDIAAPSEVAVLRSYVNIASVIGLSFGGPLGGFLSGTIGWRWSFLGQVPIAITCCLLLAYSLRSSLRTLRELQKHGEEGEDYHKPNQLTFDYPGAITLAIWISSFLAVIDLQDQLSWGHPLVLSITVVGLLALLAFLVLETYPGSRELLIPLRLFKTGVGAFCIGQLLIIAGCHGFVSLIAPYFSNTQGASDTEGGILSIPTALGNAIGSLIAGQIIRRSGCYKKLCIVSIFGCVATQIYILIRWSQYISLWESLVTFPFGIFAGIILSTQFIGLYHATSRDDLATAISTYYMCQQIGIALGVSIFSAVLKHQFQGTLQTTLAVVPNYQELIKQMLKDSSIVATLPLDVKGLVAQSYLESFWVVPSKLCFSTPNLSVARMSWGWANFSLAIAISTQVLALLPSVFTREQHMK